MIFFQPRYVPEERDINMYNSMTKKSKMSFVMGDIKAVLREPIILLFCFIPFFIMLLLRFFVPILTGLLMDYLSFDLTHYYLYIFAGIFMMTPEMLGTVSGFLMLDERDGNIAQLMMVTPMGFKGYMLRRLRLPFLLAVVYSFIGYLMFGIYAISLKVLITVALLCGLQGVIFTLILSSLADNKVKGLTYAKGMSLLIVPAFADLFKVEWFSVLSLITPFIWVVRIIQENGNYYINTITGGLIHIIWLVVLLRIKAKQLN